MSEFNDRLRKEASRCREWRRAIKNLITPTLRSHQHLSQPASKGDTASTTAAVAERRAAAEAAVGARRRSESSDTYQALCSLIKEAGLSSKTIPGLLAALSAAGGRGPDEFFTQVGEQFGRRMDVAPRPTPAAGRAWRLIDYKQRRVGLTLVERRAGERDP